MNDIDLDRDRPEPRLAAFLAARAADTAGMPTADDILDRLGSGIGRREQPNGQLRLAWLAVAVTLLAVALVGGALLTTGRRLDQDQGLPPPLDVRTNGWLAYVDGRSIVAVVPGSSDAPRTLFADTTGTWVDSPRWSPDGQKLAYFSGSAGGANGLLSVSQGGASAKLQSDIGNRVNSDDHQIAWSPDSAAIAIPERDGYASDAVGSIPVYGLDGGVQPNRIGAGRVLYAVAWSPDGRRLAFLSTDPGRIQRSIEVMNVRDGSFDLDGSGHRTLVSGGNELDLTLHGWSPDGRKLLYTARRTGNGTGQHDIETVDVDTDGVTIVSNELFDEFWPVWSPDGSRIAWQRDPGTGAIEVVVAAADGSRSRVVTTREDAVAKGPMLWSPDGHSIVTSACRSPSSCTGAILIVPVDPEGVRQLIPLAPKTTAAAILDFSWAAK